MCSVYNFGKGKALPGLKVEGDALDAFRGDLTLVRRTDSAPVYVDGEGMVSMRWGFERPQLGVVNNTRSENLDSPMWRESYTDRRCLIPVTSFYEWSGGKGNKRTHRFTAPDDSTLWVAGIWENSEALGRCYSMLTTQANSLVAPIHHRMPAILVEDELEKYLGKNMKAFAPVPETLVVNDAPNPLVKHPPSHVQDELF